MSYFRNKISTLPELSDVREIEKIFKDDLIEFSLSGESDTFMFNDSKGSFSPEGWASSKITFQQFVENGLSDNYNFGRFFNIEYLEDNSNLGWPYHAGLLSATNYEAEHADDTSQFGNVALDATGATNNPNLNSHGRFFLKANGKWDDIKYFGTWYNLEFHNPIRAVSGFVLTDKDISDYAEDISDNENNPSYNIKHAGKRVLLANGKWDDIRYFGGKYPTNGTHIRQKGREMRGLVSSDWNGDDPGHYSFLNMAGEWKMAVPPGTIVAYTGVEKDSDLMDDENLTEIEPGWFICAGQTISNMSTNYPELYLRLGSPDDNKLPDLTDKYLQGAAKSGDNLRGEDGDSKDYTFEIKKINIPQHKHTFNPEFIINEEIGSLDEGNSVNITQEGHTHFTTIGTKSIPYPTSAGTAGVFDPDEFLEQNQGDPRKKDYGSSPANAKLKNFILNPHHFGLSDAFNNNDTFQVETNSSDEKEQVSFKKIKFPHYNIWWIIKN